MATDPAPDFIGKMVSDFRRGMSLGRIASGGGDYRDQPPTSKFDRAQWFDAAMQRNPKRANKTDRQQVRQHLHRRNLIRWTRLKSDYAWMVKELNKLGINEEDVRWYL